MKTSRNYHFVLAAILVAFALAIFGGAGCSKMPNAPTANPTPVSKPDTVVVIINNPGGNTGGDDGTNSNPGGTTPTAPVLPPVASFWKTDANGVEWTYFVTWFMKDSTVTKPEPWWADPVPEWVLTNKGMDEVRALGHKFEHAGVIQLAPGATWHCNRVKGHFVAFQVESDWGQYANPGLAGNWIGKDKVDPTRPALIPGVHINPEKFEYWFTPVPWGSWL